MMQRSFGKTEQERSLQAVNLYLFIGESLSPNLPAVCRLFHTRAEKGKEELKSEVKLKQDYFA